MTESQLFANLFVAGESVGVDILGNGYVALRGTEILTDGERRDACRETVFHRVDDFIFGFSQADHNAGFGDESALADVPEDGERAVVGGSVADRWSKSPDGLKVMPHDVRRGRENRINVSLSAVKVRYQHLYGDTRRELSCFEDRQSPVRGTSVFEIVAVDRSKDGILQTHFLDAFGHMKGLKRIEGGGILCTLCGAKATGTGADVAPDHKGGSSGVPARGAIGTLAARAYRMKRALFDCVGRFGEASFTREVYLEPIGLSKGVEVIT